mmetsp:Transcript_35383/g.92040  ORF Transcript_35383/g.92040 Transcript_35383/m.92040 type:complete len:383 (-) Transcript_35383:1623-2771(-)
MAVLSNETTLKGAGVANGDMLMLRRRASMPARRAPSYPQAGQPGQPQLQGLEAAIGQFLNPQAQAQSRLRQEAINFRRIVMSNSDTLHQLMVQHPQLGTACINEDYNYIEQHLQKQQQAEERKRREELRTIAQLNSDPFDVDAQIKIEERIRQKNVEENMEAAMEHMPESFGSVVMLYVDCVLNKVPLKAFVDSGAQRTFISFDCAKRCGLDRYIDRRFAGMARGVGTAAILGRIHLANLQIGKAVIPVSLSVMEAQPMDLLIGLDNLRRHQASIDLKDNCLHIGGESVPFLSEGDLPLHLRDGIGSKEDEEEPATRGEGGAAAGSSASAGGGAAPTQAGGGTFPDETIAKLLEMGFSQEQAVRALQQAGGDADRAAAILFS